MPEQVTHTHGCEFILIHRDGISQVAWSQMLLIPLLLEALSANHVCGSDLVIV